MRTTKRLLRKRGKNRPLIKKLADTAWALMSEVVRRTGADKRGFNTCYTCKIKVHWKESNASHRWHGALDYDSMNIKNCCVRCNKWLSGNLGLFERHLIEEYGMEAVKDLEKRAREVKIYTIGELKEIIILLKNELLLLGKS